MRDKILNIQLLFVFTLTLLSIVAFYYHDSFPDSYLMISSRNATVGIIGYGFSSFVQSVEFYTGPWIILLFLFQVISHVFLFKKRNYNSDVIVILFIYPLLAIMSALLPSYASGEGIRYIAYNLFSRPELILLMCAFFLVCVCLLARAPIEEKLRDYIQGTEFKFLSINYYSSKLHELWYKLRNTLASKMKLERAANSENSKFKSEDPNVDDTENGSISDLKVPSKKPLIENLPTKDTNNDDAMLPVLMSNTPNSIVSKRNDLSMPVGKNSSMVEINQAEQIKYCELIKAIPLKKHGHEKQHPDEQYFANLVQKIEEKLQEFKIEGQILNILKGPVVDTFELELGSGVKVSRVMSIEKDLSLALYGAPIRIVYPMKGRHTLGIEIPRNPREIIYLDEVLSSKDFLSNNTHLPVAMGKDVFGQVFVVDLASMPHMLVAGATGAGKSVFINTLLVSLLVKKSPQEMKLILIDPKQLELALYSKLPHLILPVITEAKRAALSLLWAVEEMERRYKILKEMGVRNIEGFNSKIKESTIEQLAPIRQFFIDAETYLLPYIVIIVDEFADLILTKSGKDIENNVCRLAAKARASGIHLVLATQRPSVDVITGLIKSNFPTRVSFRVTTDVDSRTILGTIGAEKLLGKGDMLYRLGVETTRVHASYVDEKEIEELTKKLDQLGHCFDNNAVDFIENEGQENSLGIANNSSDDVFPDDDLYNEAVKIVIEGRVASASMLQRRLKIGYNRAANLVDEMESKGVVGPAQGARPRKVLLSAAPGQEL